MFKFQSEIKIISTNVFKDPFADKIEQEANEPELQKQKEEDVSIILFFEIIFTNHSFSQKQDNGLVIHKERNQNLLKMEQESILNQYLIQPKEAEKL